MKDDSRQERPATSDQAAGSSQEADDREFASFAAGFAASLPQLSDDAMGRLRAGLDEELLRHRQSRVPRWIARGLAVAAAVLLGIVLFKSIWHDGAAGPAPGEMSEQVVVEYDVRFAGLPAPAAPQRPLVDIERVASLVGSSAN